MEGECRLSPLEELNRGSQASLFTHPGIILAQLQHQQLSRDPDTQSQAYGFPVVLGHWQGLLTLAAMQIRLRKSGSALRSFLLGSLRMSDWAPFWVPKTQDGCERQALQSILKLWRWPSCWEILDSDATSSFSGLFSEPFRWKRKTCLGLSHDILVWIVWTGFRDCTQC